MSAAVVSKETIVLVHGWNMNRLVLEDFAKSLEHRFNVLLVDLPGHGGFIFQDCWEMNDWVEAILAQTNVESAHWCGWSLGALVVMALSQKYPERVRSLIVMAGSPKFVADADWANAVPRAVFGQFQQKLLSAPNKVRARFMGLMLSGDKQAELTKHYVSQQLKRLPSAEGEALNVGLELLSSCDYREYLRSVVQPVLMLLGKNDALIPCDVGVDVKKIAPIARLDVVEEAGHLPFVSHLGQVTNIMDEFLTGISR